MAELTQIITTSELTERPPWEFPGRREEDRALSAFAKLAGCKARDLIETLSQSVLRILPTGEGELRGEGPFVAKLTAKAEGELIRLFRSIPTVQGRERGFGLLVDAYDQSLQLGAVVAHRYREVLEAFLEHGSECDRIKFFNTTAQLFSRLKKTDHLSLQYGERAFERAENYFKQFSKPELQKPVPQEDELKILNTAVMTLASLRGTLANPDRGLTPAEREQNVERVGKLLQTISAKGLRDKITPQALATVWENYAKGALFLGDAEEYRKRLSRAREAPQLKEHLELLQRLDPGEYRWGNLAGAVAGAVSTGSLAILKLGEVLTAAATFVGPNPDDVFSLKSREELNKLKEAVSAAREVVGASVGQARVAFSSGLLPRSTQEVALHGLNLGLHATTFVPGTSVVSKVVLPSLVTVPPAMSYLVGGPLDDAYSDLKNVSMAVNGLPALVMMGSSFKPAGYSHLASPHRILTQGGVSTEMSAVLARELAERVRELSNSVEKTGELSGLAGRFDDALLAQDPYPGNPYGVLYRLLGQVSETERSRVGSLALSWIEEEPIVRLVFPNPDGKIPPLDGRKHYYPFPASHGLVIHAATVAEQLGVKYTQEFKGRLLIPPGFGTLFRSDPMGPPATIISLVGERSLPGFSSELLAAETNATVQAYHLNMGLELEARVRGLSEYINSLGPNGSHRSIGIVVSDNNSVKVLYQLAINPNLVKRDLKIVLVADSFQGRPPASNWWNPTFSAEKENTYNRLTISEPTGVTPWIGSDELYNLRMTMNGLWRSPVSNSSQPHSISNSRRLMFSSNPLRGTPVFPVLPLQHPLEIQTLFFKGQPWRIN